VTTTKLLRLSGLELALTAALMFGIATIVRWVRGPSQLSDDVTQVHLQLLIIGVAVGLLIAGLIRSPAGRASGGHMNPAVSLAMWLFGVFPAGGVAAYTLAQLTGSLLGVLAARLLWGPVLARQPVSNAVLQPTRTWSPGELFAAELLSVALILLVLAYSLSNPRLTALLPWIVGALFGSAIVLLGPYSGASENPARQFGPAVLSGQTRLLWAYLLAPMAAALAAAGVRSTFRWPPRPLTHSLCATTRSSSGADTRAYRIPLKAAIQRRTLRSAVDTRTEIGGHGADGAEATVRSTLPKQNVER
jgi:glycerol uptake facilitator-like aquaporin